jgi:hypothetical protein
MLTAGGGTEKGLYVAYALPFGRSPVLRSFVGLSSASTLKRSEVCSPRGVRVDPEKHPPKESAT